ncbi:MAG: 2,3-bisphosphoglycerate-independent phosphoglycerate mutase [Deltaproteobacteria bacterium]|nr:2,3-bisphosphoglycerate-independent phosphoglycerate mutase [Deltaproteobacteria bacterium]
MPDQRSLVLVILDGWGVNPRAEGNAIVQAATPNMDGLMATRPTSQISISGLDVGLPAGQMGNSEVGHMMLGAGRIVYQDLTLIHRSIDDGSFFSNPVLLKAMKGVQGRLHLMGLLGDGGVHAHQRHLEAILELAKRERVEHTYLHLFMDGRDTSPTSGEGFLRELLDKIPSFPGAEVSSISGRYYAMDRDKRWDRVEKAYLALSEGIGQRAPSPMDAIRKSYQQDVTDEFVIPTLMDTCYPDGTIRDGDTVLFFNFRADRARQLTRVFTQDEFKEFKRRRINLASFVTLTEYDASFDLPVAFPPRKIVNTLGEVASRSGIAQLRLAETEKYAHVTYFFNGGEERDFPGENRILVPSAKDIPTYDLKPEMSAYDITETLVKAISSDAYGLVILNYANTDMVGHTGDFKATKRACEVVDECIGKVVKAVLGKKGRLVITADHGNAEQMIDYDTGSIHTAHTSNYVPLILVDDEMQFDHIRSGTAIDVAPTILQLFDLPRPSEMSGQCLIDNLQR